MTKKLFLTCFLLQALLLSAQESKVTLSNEFEFRGEGSTHKIGDFFYRDELVAGSIQLAYTAKLKRAVYGITLYKYDGTMKEIKKMPLDGGEKTFGPLLSKLVNFDNKLLLFYYKYTDDGIMKLYMAEVKEDLTLAEPRELHSFSQKNVGLSKLYEALSNKFSYSLSPDKSKMLVAATGVPNEVFTCVVDNNTVVSKQQASKIAFSPDKDFTGTAVFIDNQSNKYLSFKYKEDKETLHSVLIQNSEGKEAYHTFTMKQSEYTSNDLYFKAARDNSKVYIYGTYKGAYLTEGIVVAVADGNGLKISAAAQYPYPDDFKKRVYKMDFGDRSKSNFSISDISYNMTELDNGTLALTGYPVVTVSYPGNGRITSATFAGPIVAAFIKDDKSTYAVIPRKQEFTSSSGCISVPYKNSIVCIYGDKEKTIKGELTDKISYANSSELVLVSAVISSDGTVMSRKKISENPDGKNYFFITDNQELSPGHYLLPLGRIKPTLSKIYTDIVQWATLSVQ